MAIASACPYKLRRIGTKNGRGSRRSRLCSTAVETFKKMCHDLYSLFMEAFVFDIEHLADAYRIYPSCNDVVRDLCGKAFFVVLFRVMFLANVIKG